MHAIIKGGLVLAAATASLAGTSRALQGGGGGLPAGGHWDADHSEPHDVLIGPLGVPQNYEIKNNGPATLCTFVCNPGVAEQPGRKIEKGETGTVGALAGGTIKGQAMETGGAAGTYVPEGS